MNEKRFFPLEGAYNVRDIGGYKTSEGKETKFGKFIRADGLDNLTKNDIEKLKNAGLQLEVDLRSKTEAKNHPSPLKDLEWIRYENVSMLDGIHTGTLDGLVPENMGEIYCWLLDNAKEAFATEFRLFLEVDNLRMFHCSAGKDRTGVTAMLLLGLVGVSDEDILENYALSEVYSSENIKKQQAYLKSIGQEVPEYMFLSNPKDMKYAMNYLREKYGTPRDYLAACGLTEQEMDAVKAILV